MDFPKKREAAVPTPSLHPSGPFFEPTSTRLVSFTPATGHLDLEPFRILEWKDLGTSTPGQSSPSPGPKEANRKRNAAFLRFSEGSCFFLMWWHFFWRIFCLVCYVLIFFLGGAFKGKEGGPTGWF